MQAAKMVNISKSRMGMEQDVPETIWPSKNNYIKMHLWNFMMLQNCYNETHEAYDRAKACWSSKMR